MSSNENNQRDNLTKLIKPQIASAWHESKAIETRAQSIDLPIDTIAALDKNETIINLLPDSVEEKQRLLKYLRVARKAFNENDIQRTKTYWYRLNTCWEDCQHNKWVAGVMKQYGKAAEFKRESDNARWDQWRKEDEIIQSQSSRPLTKSERARKIIAKLDLRVKEGTVRKRLI